MTSVLLVLAAAPLVITFVVVCVREPLRVALPVYAALIPFGGGLSIGPSRYGSISSLMGMVLGAGLLLQLITARRSVPRMSVTVPIWLLFLGAAAASTVWTIERSVTVRGVAVLGSLVLVYALIAMCKVDRSTLRRVENGLVAGGVAVVLYGLGQLIVLGGFPEGDPNAPPGVAPDGRFGNDLLGPNVQALSLLIPLVIALHRAFVERSKPVPHIVIAVLMAAGVLMTGSRGGTLAAAVVLAGMVIWSPREARRGLLTWAVVGVVAGALVWTFQPAGIASRTFDTATSSSGRLDIWLVGLAGCADYCTVGSGWGTFPGVYAQSQASVPDARVLVGDQGSYQPHNLWLLAVVELGLPGLVLLTAGLGASLIEALRLPQTRRGPPVAALAGMIVAVFFLSSMEFKFFWMVLILVALHRNLTFDEVGERPPTVSQSSTGGA